MNAPFRQYPSPLQDTEAPDGAEVTILCDKPHSMMGCDSSDPQVVGRNRRACGLEFVPDLGVLLCSVAIDRKKIEEAKTRFDPGLVRCTQTRLLNTVEILVEDYRGEGQLGFVLDNPEQLFVTVCER